MIRLKIKEAAAAQGMSQRRLSLRSGVDINTVRKLMQHPFSNVTTETLDKFAKVLGVPAETLIESVPDENGPGE